MIIKINDFSSIPYKLRLRIVQRYCELYETSKLVLVLQIYHVKCRKTKTTYVFDIWFAV